uniref:Uncharacterized protein n=1 Tax=Chromera velia CCMP2878 TaxID=1169474 RepID=A0A0G4FZU6_9ALVE|eukprot:Cvel_19427.t1-p1 / transcript=Cvel_19427.t1 / gene=Cvel_19427 / organism=Chromera_velia_CCMP2878 / gene_product=hypothetical protein / transcript_product=hypothetical protein / location=Cvel_scaffold1673:28883-30916(+) / protein_length=73 / sequence_SO=supercontig / SO=protein_coding / is_pseudo=false
MISSGNWQPEDFRGTQQTAHPEGCRLSFFFSLGVGRREAALRGDCLAELFPCFCVWEWCRTCECGSDHAIGDF